MGSAEDCGSSSGQSWGELLSMFSLLVGEVQSHTPAVLLHCINAEDAPNQWGSTAYILVAEF